MIKNLKIFFLNASEIKYHYENKFTQMGFLYDTQYEGRKRHINLH